MGRAWTTAIGLGLLVAWAAGTLHAQPGPLVYPMPQVPNAQDKLWWAVIQDKADLEGNRDGIWFNEWRPAGQMGGGFLVLKPTEESKQAWRVWRDAHVGPATLTSTGDPLKDALAANTLIRFGLPRASFTDAVVTSPASGDTPARQIYVQRWDPVGTPTSVTVIVPGYTESTSDWRHVVAELARRGSRVYVFDPPGQGFSDGRSGDVEDSREWLRAYRVVYDRARAQNASLPLIVLGHSTGGGVVADDLHDRVAGQIVSRGPDGAVFTAPYLALRDNFMNNTSGFLGSIPWVSRIQLPPMIKLSDDALGARRLAQWQRVYEASQAPHFVDVMSGMTDRHAAWLAGRTGLDLPFVAIQGKDDNVTDPAVTRRFVAQSTGGSFVELSTGSHDLQYDPAGLPALIAGWERILGQLRPSCE